jgi:beta-galactosidase
MNMEALGQGFGFILYETTTPPASSSAASAASADNATQTLGFHPYPRDRCHAFVDGRPALAAPLYRPTAPAAASLNASASGGQTLSLLVENMGRLNYGSGMFDHKVRVVAY